MVKTIKSAIVNRRIDELQKMFSSEDYDGSVQVERDHESQKIVVTIRTRDIMSVNTSEDRGLHGALQEADNYSFHAEADELVIRLGYFVGMYPVRG